MIRSPASIDPPDCRSTSATEAERIKCESSDIGQLDRQAIAELSMSRIMHMSEQDLVRVIEIAKPPFLQRGDSHQLAYLDRCTLLRLAYLTRRYCQHHTETPPAPTPPAP